MRSPFQIHVLQGLFERHRKTWLIAQAVLFVLVGMLLSRWLWWSPPQPSPSVAEATLPVSASTSAPSTWTCSMHPQIRQPNPGKCPICGMDLIPVSTSAGGLRTLTISPETRALMSISSAPVERKYVKHEIPMAGKVDYDETKVGHITAWVPGRLDRLYVDYTGVQVNQGDHMVYIYSPELYTAQEELIQAVKNRRDPSASRTRLIQPIDLVGSAREKLRLLGLSEDQIGNIEQQQQPSDHLTIYSPVSGIVIGKLKQEGDYVKTGERIYTVADLKQVWVHLDAYESDLPWIRYGQDVTITTEAYPGDEFHGRVAFIQPVVNDKTRTVKVRVNVPNVEGRLKPDMFVHAVVRPEVATGGRVMDPSLAGKWISPMHPEIVKDAPGKCDICGMPLVRAESLGFVTAATDPSEAPLVIPYSAALVTGRRAVIYVELPTMPQGIESAYQGLASAVAAADLASIRNAFTAFGKLLDRPYDQPATEFARHQWNHFADRLAEIILLGQRVTTLPDMREVMGRLEPVMSELRESFAPVDEPTFEGREIVLGPRAGDYYLVRHGVQEGELVVAEGNFKIDAEIQIQAKPSMMTPDGGGGHAHGDSGGQWETTGSHAGHAMALTPEFRRQLANIDTAYEQVAEAIDRRDLAHITAAFSEFRQQMANASGPELGGTARDEWKELAMLLGNDAAEGSDVQQSSEADRVFLLLKAHMRRLRGQFAWSSAPTRIVEHIVVSEAFQHELARIWQHYVLLQQALASDSQEKARQALIDLKSTSEAVAEATLAAAARPIWRREEAALAQLLSDLDQATDLTQLRTEFKPLSEELGVLAKTFGFGAGTNVYELHCPMAFQGQGAIWYQQDDQVRNPYFGATMLNCADRVERIVRDQPARNEDGEVTKSHSRP